MKFLIVLVAVAAAGYFFYDRHQSVNPAVIESPVYAELRMATPIQGREISMVLFGEMASREDCEQRADRVWQKLIDGCKDCTMTLSSCKTELEPRYQRLFADTAIHSTYLSFNRGNRYERNGRMVVYGLTSDEGDMLCGTIKAGFEQHYEGAVDCVQGRRD
jgi:hypothetical protein